jgi:hypothetical protein
MRRGVALLGAGLAALVSAIIMANLPLSMLNSFCRRMIANGNYENHQIAQEILQKEVFTQQKLLKLYLYFPMTILPRLGQR